MPEEVTKRVEHLFKADQQPDLLTFYDRKYQYIGESDITRVEADYDNYNDGIDDMDPPTTNNDFGLDPLPVTPNTNWQLWYHGWYQ